MTEDLSARHEPVGGLFPRPASAREWERHRLSAEQVEFFREHGYLSGIRVLSESQVGALRGELADLMHPAHEGRALFHALGAWRVAAGFHDLLWHPAFTVAASQLLGDARVRFWHDQLFCKPARHGGVVAWHQDYSYWTRTTPLAHLTCWVGLDDATRENGCVHYVPGSHRWDDLPVTGLAGDMDAIQTVLTDEQKSLFKPVAIELKAGE